MITQPGAFGLVIREIAIDILLRSPSPWLLVAGADVVWSRFHWRRDLRMTKQEVKDELKQSDGDPIIKSRMRSLARDRARRRMMAAVPRATLVIANPTHYSIALKYVREEDSAPDRARQGPGPGRAEDQGDRRRERHSRLRGRRRSPAPCTNKFRLIA